MLDTYVAAGVVGSVGRLEAHRSVDIVTINFASLKRVLWCVGAQVVEHGAAVVEEIRPDLVGDHAVAPHELQLPPLVQVKIQQRIAKLIELKHKIVFLLMDWTTDDRSRINRSIDRTLED